MSSCWRTPIRPHGKEGYGYEVVNASSVAETTAGGLARLPRALAMHHPRVVILELGSTDGLRAFAIDQMRSNLAKMIDLSVGDGAQVLLLGMRAPPAYGPEYAEKFFSTFADVARAGRRVVHSGCWITANRASMIVGASQVID